MAGFSLTPGHGLHTSRQPRPEPYSPTQPAAQPPQLTFKPSLPTLIKQPTERKLRGDGNSTNPSYLALSCYYFRKCVCMYVCVWGGIIKGVRECESVEGGGEWMWMIYKCSWTLNNYLKHTHRSPLQYFCHAVVQEWKWHVIDARKHRPGPGGTRCKVLLIKSSIREHALPVKRGCETPAVPLASHHTALCTMEHCLPACLRGKGLPSVD